MVDIPSQDPPPHFPITPAMPSPSSLQKKMISELKHSPAAGWTACILRWGVCEVVSSLIV